MENVGSDFDSYQELCQANSGAIRFQVKSASEVAQIYLCGINPPHKTVYFIQLGALTRIKDDDNNEKEFRTYLINIREQFQEFWLTWFGGVVRIGLDDCTEPFITYKSQSSKRKTVGFIIFYKEYGSRYSIDWIYETPPTISQPMQLKKINGGQLRWVKLTKHKLPPDALIGGFEEEPTYIACAEHMGSTCPGKYVPSKRLAFVPWGGREHEKQNFKILCGYNATWVQTSGNRIPHNAFIGGVSEVGQEPLYIGRAVHDGNLINGKIHVLYHTCYLPYEGKEVEVYSFEILVLPDVQPRSVLPKIKLKLES